MSASNWAICPCCLDAAREAAKTEETRLGQLYGSVPLKEFEAARDAARRALKPVNPEGFRTFREDYEIYGAGNGTVNVSYKGRCTRCGLGLEFAEQHEFYA